MKTTTETHPANAFSFTTGPFTFGDSEKVGNHTEKPVRLLARSSDPIDHWYWGKVAHDLSGRKHKATIPIDYAHGVDGIGVVEGFSEEEDGLWLEGRLIPFDEKDKASEVIFKGDRGVPYEASINFAGEGVEYQRVEEGEVSEVNGKEFAGPGIIIRKWPLRGVAICLYGADQNTNTEFSETDQITATCFSKGPEMAEETQTADEKLEAVKTEETIEETIEETPEAIEPAQAEAPTDASEFKQELAKFQAAFGAADGAAWFAADMSFADASLQFAQKMKAERDAALKANALLEATISQADLGEEEGVGEFSESSEASKPKKTLAGFFN